MPVLNQVERRSAWGRTIVAAVYLLLIIGGVTMLFPFSVMFAGSISSGVDSHQQALFPAYLRDDDVLFVKFLEHKYGTKQPRNPLPHVNRSLGTDFLSIPSMLNHRGEQLPVLRLSSDARAGRAADWSAFLATVLYEHRIRAFDETLQVDFADYLDDLLDGDLDRLKHELKSEATAFEHVRLPFEDPYRRGWRRPATAMVRAYDKFLRDRDLDRWTIPVLFDGEFARFLIERYGTITQINAALNANFHSIRDITLPRNAPSGPLSSAWHEYVRKKLPLHHVVLEADPQRWRAYLHDAGVAKHWNPTPRLPVAPEQRDRWTRYVTDVTTLDELHVHTNDPDFRAWLVMRYNRSIHDLNHAWDSSSTTFDQVRPPLPSFDYAQFHAERGGWRWRFVVTNYVTVWREIAVHGRALWNTLFLCAATVIAALTINPMCAYGLSRFPLSYKHKVILFLIAPMSFPAMVLMIPNFLLLRELHLLNTYWALILPGIASGFSIFLLKGFFDSLPPELYESAGIEGANEWQMFFHITLPMVKPILAVQALGAFTAAYGGFMWAFIICQDPRMWTIMVYLYQFQQRSPYHLVMASLVIASLPLLVVFLFAQRTIMRGIVIPVMK